MTWKDLLQQAKQVLSEEIVVISGTSVTVATLIVFLTIILFTFALAGFLRRNVERVLLKRAGQDEGTAGVLSRLLRYATLVVGFSVGLHTMGINLSALFAAGALFAVAVGFAMQNVVANFVSGVILLAERVIKPGDIIEVEGQMVRVRDMSIRATIVRTLDEEDLVLPNSMLVQSTVKNFTMHDRLYRIRVAVGVAYESDLQKVRMTLESCLKGLDWRSSMKEPVVLLSDFGASSVDYEVSLWIEDPWHSRTSRSKLREAIWGAFQEASITIAFPQVDVHLDDAVVESLRPRSVA